MTAEEIRRWDKLFDDKSVTAETARARARIEIAAQLATLNENLIKLIERLRRHPECEGWKPSVPAEPATCPTEVSCLTCGRLFPDDGHCSYCNPRIAEATAPRPLAPQFTWRCIDPYRAQCPVVIQTHQDFHINERPVCALCNAEMFRDKAGDKVSEGPETPVSHSVVAGDNTAAPTPQSPQIVSDCLRGTLCD
jgi:hypothetical protein